jgi:hypothetical protein
MGDAPTPEQSFAESFGKLKSGAQSDVEKFGPKKNVRSEEARLPYDPPRISGDRGETYPMKAPDLDHLDAARFERVPLSAEDSRNAIAHATNLSGFECMTRMTTTKMDQALDSMLHGHHFSPDRIGTIIANLESDCAALQGAPSAALEQLLQSAHEAQTSGKSLVFVKDHLSIPDEVRRNALTEELNHAAQRAATGPLDRHMQQNAAAFTSGARGQRAQSSLEQNMQYQFNSPSEAAAEIGVRLMDPNRYQELGLSRAEAHALAYEYVQRLEKEYGRARISDLRNRVLDAFR